MEIIHVDLEIYYTLQIFNELCRLNAQTLAYQQFLSDISRE